MITWNSWFRAQGSRTWRVIATGTTEAEATRKGLDVPRGSGEAIVLPAGRHPSDRPLPDPDPAARTA
jgi:hypothetical protein